MGSSQSLPYSLKNLAGQTYVVTGANTGLGLASCKEFARQGALVVMACRNKEKGEQALQEVQKEGKAELRLLDLSDLDSVDAFVTELKSAHPQVHCLLNNAGIMACPQGTTKQGMDSQLGTNHFGHFALTMKMLPLLKAAPEARIVSVSSVAATHAAPGKIDWEDFQYQKPGRYDAWTVYGLSKLCNLLFTFKLQEKLDAAGVKNITTLAAHPGSTHTELQRHSGLARFLGSWIVPSMKPEDGAKPQVLASAGKDVKSGQFIGPSGWMEMSGPPTNASVPTSALNKEWQDKLWKLSEEITKTSFA